MCGTLQQWLSAHNGLIRRRVASSRKLASTFGPRWSGADLAYAIGRKATFMASATGPFMTELFPTAVRGVGQSFCYNVGRGIGAVFPALVGFLAARLGLPAAIAIFNFAGLALMILALLMLPETRGRSLASREHRLPA
jgi:hypothetical protein